MKIYYVVPTLFSTLSVNAFFASTAHQHHDDSALELQQWRKDGTNATTAANATTTTTTSVMTNATNVTTATIAPTMAPVDITIANTHTQLEAHTSTTCTLAAVKAGTCDFASQYCTVGNVYQPPGMRKFGCMVKPKGNYLKYNLTNWCFESVFDRIGKAWLPNTSATTGFCTSGTMDLNFTSDYSLTSVEITRELSGRAVGSIREVSAVSACDDDEAANADFYFAGSFCKDPCPLLYEINGVACSGTCTPCSNGGAVAAAWDCSNVDASLVQTCNDAKKLDPLELVLIYLQGLTKATTPANTTNAPLALPGAEARIPANGTITERSTISHNTNDAPTIAPTEPQPSKSTASNLIRHKGKVLTMIGMLATFSML